MQPATKTQAVNHHHRRQATRRASYRWLPLLVLCIIPLGGQAASALQEWTKIKDSGSCTDYRQFVATYGDSPLASMARTKVRDCDRQAEQAASDAWQQASERGSCNGYRSYLEDHPDGPNAAKAQTEIDRCAAEEQAQRAAAAEAEAERRAAKQQANAKRAAEAKARREAEQQATQQAKQAKQDLGCGNGFWSPNQLTAYFGGHTWEGWAGKTKWQEYYASNGALLGRAWKNGQRRPNYSGKWYLSDNRYCYCTGACLSYACRKVMQKGCETWTWDIERNKSRSQVNGVYQGNPFGL